MAMKVTQLRIEEFRRFRDITIPFGDRVTLIAGQNGTSKSTLLGMLAQPFSFGIEHGEKAGTPDASVYTSNYHGRNLHELTDLAGKPFMYDCDDVFRLSAQHDFGKEYRYHTQLSQAQGLTGYLQENSLFTRSRNRTRGTRITGMRFVTGPRASHQPGEGNFPHPVIYLGLNRLWPLAVTTKFTFSSETITEDDRSWYVKQYDEILCLEEHGNTARFMDTKEKKKFIAPESKTYDGESCSAGQDNLAQLLTAILSFRRLKKLLGTRYQGGMLLIDELDATLHAFAQDRLLSMLCEQSKQLELQVIVTTHSMWLLEKAYQSALKEDIAVLCLSNSDGRIVTERFTTFQDMVDHLKIEVTRPQARKPRKVSVVFEDDEAKHFFQQICGSRLRTYVHCANTASLAGGNLKNIADMSSKLHELRDVILIPDGDLGKTWNAPPSNLLCLPGGCRPETLVYRHLHSMKDADEFWERCGGAYNRQFAITKEGGTSVNVGDDKEWVKRWYTRQSKHWGRSNEKVFKSWVQSHKPECLEFCRRFIKLLSGRYKGEITKKVVESTLAPLR